MNDEAVLNYDLFAGDRDVDVTIFSNKMVRTRKPHKCVICQEPIPVGERVRAQTERDNDDKIVMTFYVCPTCCEACAVAGTEADESADRITARYSIGMDNAHREVTA